MYVGKSYVYLPYLFHSPLKETRIDAFQLVRNDIE